MTMPIALLAAALGAQILPAPGAVRWEQVADETSGRSFIDPASLTRDGDIVRFLNRSDQLVDEGDGLRMIVARMALDCRRRTIGLIESDLYGEDGRLLRSIRVGPEGVAFAPLGDSPGSNQVVRRVCGAPGASN